MRNLGDAELLQVVVIQAPSDIVMAAQVIEERVLVRKGEDLAQLVLQKAHIMRCDRMPG